MSHAFVQHLRIRFPCRLGNVLLLGLTVCLAFGIFPLPPCGGLFRREDRRQELIRWVPLQRYAVALVLHGRVLGLLGHIADRVLADVGLQRIQQQIGLLVPDDTVVRLGVQHVIGKQRQVFRHRQRVIACQHERMSRGGALHCQGEDGAGRFANEIKAVTGLDARRCRQMAKRLVLILRRHGKRGHMLAEFGRARGVGLIGAVQPSLHVEHLHMLSAHLRLELVFIKLRRCPGHVGVRIPDPRCTLWVGNREVHRHVTVPDAHAARELR